MAVTENNYVGDNSTVLYSFTFPYIEETDIKITLDEVATTEYTLANATQVQFNSPPGSGVKIRIYRDTDIDELKAEFFPGSAIRAQDLNVDFRQNNYAVQELANYTWSKTDETITSTEPWISDDGHVATTAASDQRFETLVQTETPSSSGWLTGKGWFQNDSEKTFSIFDGTNWIGVASGGTFTNQPKVIYVDATAGDDANYGHRISRPKATIKAAVNQINSDATYGEGSVVVVAPGVYQEVAPIDITKKDVSIIGQALRSCVVHPTPATEQNTMFRLNSGSYIANLTITGVKASGTRGNSTIDGDATYGLPENQGWNFAFYPGAMIYKSPYIQNCTNFSDSEINNGALTPHTPAGGAGGDTDSAMTGGGLLIDGSVPDADSPLRSMVCDSYTHVGLDGPGILVTNNGYCQATSSYSFFTHYHIKCRNGGQANLAASTTDFGRYSLIADGRSPNAIFTATTSASANSGDITFSINPPIAGSPWHGTANRPQSNMLVDIGGNTYSILSATDNGSGWDVTISRPNPTNKSENLGLNGSVGSGAAVSFYLRSMIASSGHTMEYVGSGTNYTALPENGGVSIEGNQVVELNNGKIWAAITDHNGKFKLGDTLIVDQQVGFVTIPSGSISFDLASDLSPQLGANLDVLNKTISSSTGNVIIDDTLDVNSHKIINVIDPTNAQDAATKGYTDTTKVAKTSSTGSAVLPVGTQAQRDGSPSAGYIRFNTDVGKFEGYSGAAWTSVGGVTTSDTAPTSPSDGDLWWDSSAGVLYVWYDDGSSSQWVAANPQTPTQYWQRNGTTLSPATAGDTVSGNLLPTNGSLGFRNVIINGDMRINQRGVTIAAAAAGQYGPDRWKKVDASNMTQIIESGNFVPGATYTLSGTGVTTQQLTAPASGDWTLPNIPIAATNIQLERGTIATPFELRPIGQELMLCQRYYAVVNVHNRAYITAPGYSATTAYWPAQMRTSPTAILVAGNRANVSSVDLYNPTPTSVRHEIVGIGGGTPDAYALAETIYASAEL